MERITGVVRADVAVIAVDNLRMNAEPGFTMVARSAFVVVVTFSVGDCVHAALKRIAGVVCARVVVIASELNARKAARVGIAGLNTVADVAVIAVHRNTKLASGLGVAAFRPVAWIIIITVKSFSAQADSVQATVTDGAGVPVAAFVRVEGMFTAGVRIATVSCAWIPVVAVLWNSRRTVSI